MRCPVRRYEFDKIFMWTKIKACYDYHVEFFQHYVNCYSKRCHCCIVHPSYILGFATYETILKSKISITEAMELTVRYGAPARYSFVLTHSMTHEEDEYNKMLKIKLVGRERLIEFIRLRLTQHLDKLKHEFRCIWDSPFVTYSINSMVCLFISKQYVLRFGTIPQSDTMSVRMKIRSFAKVTRQPAISGCVFTVTYCGAKPKTKSSDVPSVSSVTSAPSVPFVLSDGAKPKTSDTSDDKSGLTDSAKPKTSESMSPDGMKTEESKESTETMPSDESVKIVTDCVNGLTEDSALDDTSNLETSESIPDLTPSTSIADLLPSNEGKVLV